MAQRKAGERYSLWLMPRGDVYESLARTLHRLSARYAAPEFPPHVTLLGRIAAPRREALRKSAALAALLRPFTIRLGDIAYFDEYFRCLFVRVAITPPLLKAHHVAQEVFGFRRMAPFMPHLSLLYGNFSQSLKDEGMAELGPPVGREFKVRSLHLYSTRGEPRGWRCVGKFGFGSIRFTQEG
jgi:2'-5' RNA ligase